MFLYFSCVCSSAVVGAEIPIEEDIGEMMTCMTMKKVVVQQQIETEEKETETIESGAMKEEGAEHEEVAIIDRVEEDKRKEEEIAEIPKSIFRLSLL